MKMKYYILIGLILSILLISGCIQQYEKQSTITKTGRIYVFGNEPFVELGLEVEGEKTYCLIGPLKDELWDFQNSIVTVEGNIIEEYFCRSLPEGKTINVISYKIK